MSCRITDYQARSNLIMIIMMLPATGISADDLLSDFCDTMDAFSIAVPKICLRLVSRNASAARKVIHEVDLAKLWTKTQFDLGKVGISKSSFDFCTV